MSVILAESSGSTSQSGIWAEENELNRNAAGKAVTGTRLAGDAIQFARSERVNEFETVVGGILCSVRAGKVEFGELAARWWLLGGGCSVVAARWWLLGGGCSVIDVRSWVRFSALQKIKNLQRRVRSRVRPVELVNCAAIQASASERQIHRPVTRSARPPVTLVLGRWWLVGGGWSVVAGRWWLVGGGWSVVAGRW
jgi:hypothetical protein